MDPITNIKDAKFEPGMVHEDKFAFKMAKISTLLGARKLGYNVTAVPPGKRPFPFHNHRVNEEMVLIIEGEGTLRYGDQEFDLKKFDIMAFPPGDRSTAHQIINTGSTELKFLCVSTREDPEICEYPDSNKVAYMCGDQSDPDRLVSIGRPQMLNYFDGE